MAKSIDNPCVSVCEFSGDVCVGCGRDKAEIRSWKKMKRSQKMGTVQRAEQRLKKLRK